MKKNDPYKYGNLRSRVPIMAKAMHVYQQSTTKGQMEAIVPPLSLCPLFTHIVSVDCHYIHLCICHFGPASCLLLVCHCIVHVTVDESIREEDGSDDEENNEDIKEYVCQLLDQRTASQRRDKSCAPSH